MKLTFWDFLHKGRQLKQCGFTEEERMIFRDGMKYAEKILKGKKKL